MQFCRAIVVGIRAAFVVADNITPFREYIGETPHAPRDTSARNEPDFIDFNGLTICWGCIVCCSLTCFFCSSATRLSDTISTSSSSQSFWAVATVIFFASSSTDIVSTYSRHNQAIYVAKPRKKKKRMSSGYKRPFGATHNAFGSLEDALGYPLLRDNRAAVTAVSIHCIALPEITVLAVQAWLPPSRYNPNLVLRHDRSRLHSKGDSVQQDGGTCLPALWPPRVSSDRSGAYCTALRALLVAQPGSPCTPAITSFASVLKVFFLPKLPVLQPSG